MLEVAVAEPRERPILFSGPMVPPVLADTKTQTRRAMRPQPPAHTVAVGRWQDPPGFDAAYWAFVREGPAQADHPFAGAEIHGEPWRCPYGVPGDRLWVREAWADLEVVSRGNFNRKAIYRADDIERYGDEDEYVDVNAPGMRWRPSIHMPRWASRILLEVTEVRVQRLQDISEADALAEGIQAMRCPDCHLASYGLPGWGHDQLNPTGQGAYRYLWESINGAGSWDLNPWVWAVSFKRASTAKLEFGDCMTSPLDLPKLPEPVSSALVQGLFGSEYRLLSDNHDPDPNLAKHSENQMRDYARSAVLADRASRWLAYDLTPECLAKLPAPGAEVLLWTLEDYWDDTVHVLRGAVHMGEVREEGGFRYLTDYMDTDHSAVTKWMPLPAPPLKEEMQIPNTSQEHLIASEASRLQEDAPPTHTHSDYADGFDAGREQAYAECVALALQWSVAREPEYGGMALENFAEELQRRSAPQQPFLVMGEAIEKAHPLGCEERAAPLASSLSNEKNAASVGGASAQVQVDGDENETANRLRFLRRVCESKLTGLDRIECLRMIGWLEHDAGIMGSADSTRGASNG